MKSPKRRTTSKSGNSRTSTSKGTSKPPETSSATAPASFVEVFGRREPPELEKLRESLKDAKAQLEDHVAHPVMPTAPKLFRSLHDQKRWRLSSRVRELEDAIEYLEKGGDD